MFTKIIRDRTTADSTSSSEVESVLALPRRRAFVIAIKKSTFPYQGKVGKESGNELWSERLNHGLFLNLKTYFSSPAKVSTQSASTLSRAH